MTCFGGGLRSPSASSFSAKCFTWQWTAHMTYPLTNSMHAWLKLCIYVYSRWTFRAQHIKQSTNEHGINIPVTKWRRFWCCKVVQCWTPNSQFSQGSETEWVQYIKTSPFSAVHFWIQQWNNYLHKPTFAKLMVTNIRTLRTLCIALLYRWMQWSMAACQTHAVSEHDWWALQVNSANCCTGCEVSRIRISRILGKWNSIFGHFYSKIKIF